MRGKDQIRHYLMQSGVLSADYYLPQTYAELIALAEESYSLMPKSYAGGWQQWIKRLKDRETFSQAAEFFRSRLNGRVLLDLGGGQGLMADLAHYFGVAMYINVDKSILNRMGTRGDMSIVSLREDILALLAACADNSAVICMNGIDQDVIPLPDYHAALAHEIERVLQPAGIVFGVQSKVFELFQHQSQLREITVLFGGFQASELQDASYLYEKVVAASEP